jgi:hypothetical protein
LKISKKKNSSDLVITVLNTMLAILTLPEIPAKYPMRKKLILLTHARLTSEPVNTNLNRKTYPSKEDIVDLISTIIKYMPGVEALELVAERPISHPKGPKTLMRVNIGDPIPPGVILGKGTVLKLRAKHQSAEEGDNRGRKNTIG